MAAAKAEQKTTADKPKTSSTIVDFLNDDCLHGDILQYNIISRLFTLDLLPASQVSKAWRAAVFSSLRHHRCRPPPSLVVNFQRIYNSSSSKHITYNPISNSWSTGDSWAPKPSLPVSAAYTSSGVRLCTLSVSKNIAISVDPFGSTWMESEAPRFWRTEPLVAVIGQYIVIAGGVNEYEDASPNAVEVLNLGANNWESCEPIPEVFGWTGSVSAAATDRKFYVVDKQSPWWASWFDPKTKNWLPARQLRLPETVKLSSIGILDGRTVVAGAEGIGGIGAADSFRPTSVRFWMVDDETMEIGEEKEKWRMPPEMVAGLMVDDEDGGWGGMRSIGFLTDGMFGYIYNPSQPREFFLCEFRSRDDGDECRWERVVAPAALEERIMTHKMIFECSSASRYGSKASDGGRR